MKRRAPDESGTALILALVFLVTIAVLAVPMMNSITSGLRVRAGLDAARNREYSADGAIENSIAQVRMMSAASTDTGPGFSACGPYTFTLDNVITHVDCAPLPTITRSGIEQRDVVFTACVQSGSLACGLPQTPVVIRAQVNFQATGSGSTFQITRTWVQSWSVDE